MKYLSLFSGIGTAEKGIEQAYENRRNNRNGQTDIQLSGRCETVNGNGDDYPQDERPDARSFDGTRSTNPHCIGYAEIDRYASAIYRYHWPETRNYGDATTIICDELPDFDFLVGGFPCQAFSIAGKRKGFTDTRGTLFFEIARILEAKRPGHFLLENVAGLLSHDDGQTFRTIIATLDEIGYDLEWTVINSKHHGVPQNRERVFIIGHPRNGGCGEILSFGEFDGEVDAVQRETGGEREWLSVSTESHRRDTTGIESGRDGCERYGDSVTIGTLRTHKDGEGFREMQSNAAPSLNARARQDGSQQGVIQINASRESGGKQPYQQNRVYDANGIAPANQAGLSEGSYAVKFDKRIRRLTEIECERLQALPDNFTKYGNFDGEIREISSTQRYKTLGNAMTVSVIEAIVSKMIEKGCF